ncbi:MAG: N-carbamoylputrescine amidase [Deltaproteobacteria bacterium]|nr:MAG: N-carbamoylputrescine amidase [Deltaproteobacteria bacterium]TMQ21045.1 MAG: N-carbamoylputrescine amidase [Deltaproteobacteria bacterium]
MEVTVAALQTALTDDVAENVARVTALVRQAAGRGAQIVLPSELFEGHYFCRAQREAEFARARPADEHPTLRQFQALAAELGVVIPVSFFEQAGPEHYNSVAVIDADGRRLGVYRKSHIPDGPGYQEKFYFKPGNTGFRAFATRFGTIGVAICWDQWFPEAARAMTLAGADVLFYPTAIGTEPEEPELDSRDAWQRVMIGHAVANAVGVVAANRIGTEGAGPTAVAFYGSSFVADARGDKRAELGRDETGIALATLDLEQIRRIRASMGFFRDRRPSLYRALTD